MILSARKKMLVRSLTFVLAAILIASVFSSCSSKDEDTDTASAADQSGSQKRAHANIPRSGDCRECHQDVYDQWAISDHAHANRNVDMSIDRAAFDPERSLKHGSFVSDFRVREGKLEIETTGPKGYKRSFHPNMVLAYEPLRQYLVPFAGGRWQATELAFDPAKEEWFNVYGEQDRQPDEWGYWANRGMNWNSNCAFCHTTDFHKNYDVSNDLYRSTWAEHGISCYQCHGEMEGHAEAHRRGKGANRTESPHTQALLKDKSVWMDNCFACHSRREELTGEFKPGEKYHDHFRLQLPVREGLYYPDGQIRDEVFVHASFMMSKMGHAGVSCADCHNHHTGKLVLPVENNALCMKCHTAPGIDNAPPINPLEHSHHPEGSTGNRCVECHMTHTTYMERDPRRDHGYHIPDPLLTKELGIPNACSKCHTDESVDWAIEWTDKWYGEKMNRPERERTRAVARAYEGDPTVIRELLPLYEKEKNPLWRATLLTLSAPWAFEEEVRKIVRAALKDEHPVIRSAAVQALAPFPEEHDQLKPALKDETRLVRLDAAWALREQLDRSLPVYDELKKYLRNTADQPAGAARNGQLAFVEGRGEEAEAWYQKAIEWDKYSAPLYNDLALIQNSMSKGSDVLDTLLAGQKVAPNDPQFPFMIALHYAELNQPEKVEEYLVLATTIDPNFVRAWYNLSLVYSQQKKLDAALNTLAKAEKLAPGNPEYPYTRATLLMRQGQIEGAIQAARWALQLDPNFGPAKQFLQMLKQE